MNVIWIILAVLSFIAGQVYLFRLLRKLDLFFDRTSAKKPTLRNDDSCRSSEDVIE